MADVNGGALSFTSIMNNDKMNAAIEETLRRVQGFSNAVVGSGDAMDKTTQEIVESINIQKRVISELENTIAELNDKINSVEPGAAQDALIERANAARAELEGEKQDMVALITELNNLQRANSGAASSAEEIRATLSQVCAACEMNEKALAALEEEYEKITKQMNGAFKSGNDAEYRALRDKAQAIKGEMTTRKSLLADLRKQSNALEESAGRIEKERQAVEKNATAHVSLRQRINELQEEMADYRKRYGDQTEEYRKMAAELGNLKDIQSDIRAQGKILSNDENQFAGIISGLNGIVGGFTAAQGVVALFAGENENLQKIMLKVQSLMSITIGLQQVAQTLNKDSAFTLVTLNRLKQWWNKLTGQSVVEETAETTATTASTAANTANAASLNARMTATTGASVATGANTVATGANTVAAGAGTVANWSFAASFRAIGAAIKSIPVFGWVLAGISAIVSVVTLFTDAEDENTEAIKKNKKAQEDLQSEMTATERVHAETIKQVAEERGKIQMLNSIVHDNTIAIGDRKKALDEIKKIIPSYHAMLSEEGELTRDNIKAIDDYIAALDRQAMAKAAMKELEALSTKEVQNRLKQIKAQREMDKNEWANKDYVNPNDATNRDKGYENTAVRDATAVREQVYQQQQAEAANAMAAYSKAEQDWKAAKQYAQKIAQDKADVMSLIKEKGLTSDVVASSGDASGGGSTPLGTNHVETDLEKLERLLSAAKKSYQEYYKWINSGDKIIIEAAGQEFSGLLAQGKTYLDYLTRQRQQILDIDASKRTTEQTDALRKLNEEIANETKATVLEAFNNELSTQLGNAKSIIEMLSIIEQKRKEIKDDGSELDNNKKDALDDAEAKVVEKQKERTKQLLDDYASYTTKKLKLEQEYVEDMLLLQKQLDNATTTEEKDAITKAMENRRVQYNKGSGDENYDALKENYRTFQEKVTAIKEEYEEKRRVATLHNDTALLNQLATAEANELSKLQSDLIKNSADWQYLFGNLDELTTSTIKKLIEKIDGMKTTIGVDLNPQDLNALTNQLDKARAEVEKRNPFTAIGTAWKSLKEVTKDGKGLGSDEAKKATKDVASAVSESINLVNGTFNAVTDGLQKMGVSMDEETQAILSDLGGIMEGASQVAQGIATGNPLSVIQGSIGLLSSAFDLFNSRDRKAEKQIKKHQEAITKLQNTYKQLEWQIDKALGGEVYKNQQAAIRNMQEQQAHLKASWEAEISKKKTDWQRVDEFKEQYEELGRQIEDMLDEISNDLLQTNVKDFANELGDALVEAFGKGEDAAKAMETTVNSVLKNLVLNQLKKNFLETQLQGALDQLEKDMGYWSGDNFIFDGLSDAEIARFKASVGAASENFNNALKLYEDLFKDLGLEDTDESLTGAVKGVSEDTANILAGQMNAIRINQLESTQILRQSLQALNTIAANTAYNKYLARIERIITILETNQSSDALRSQGLA